MCRCLLAVTSMSSQRISIATNHRRGCTMRYFSRSLERGTDLGYTDAFRTLHPGEGGHFTFWDYFRQAFAHNRGIRIDHFLLSPQLAKRLVSCEIDKRPRGAEKPSDHAPIVLELRLTNPTLS